MESLSPSLEDWRKLYDAAIEFKRLACWEWLTDEHVFGVQNPATGEISYCCVLGNNEEVYGLAVYLGQKGLAGLLKMQSGELEPGDSDVIHIQKCLMVSYDDRNYLQPQDLKQIKALGFKFRGANAWPSFRSYEPGYVPWELTTPEQVEFLTLAIQQAIELAKRYSYPSDKLFLSEDGEYLTRVAELVNGSLEWSERWMKPEFGEEEPETELVSYPIDELRLTKLQKSIKGRASIWEIDSFYAPMPVNQGNRPFFPRMAMFIDQETDQILHFHLSEDASDHMNWGGEFVQLMERLKVMPEAIWVRNEAHLQYIATVLHKCKIVGKIVPALPSIEAAKEEMFQFIGK